jgi:hypothetical protein
MTALQVRTIPLFPAQQSSYRSIMARAQTTGEEVPVSLTDSDWRRTKRFISTLVISTLVGQTVSITGAGLWAYNAMTNRLTALESADRRHDDAISDLKGLGARLDRSTEALNQLIGEVRASNTKRP